MSGWHARLPRLVLAAAVAATLAVGVIGVTEPRLRDFDTRFWFVGGAAWWGGASPYDYGAFASVWESEFGPLPPSMSFVYPGTIAPLALLLGWMPWPAASWAMRGVGLAALVGSLVVLRRVIGTAAPEGVSRTTRDVFLAAAAGVPALGLALHQGQPTVIVLLGVCLAWRGYVLRSEPSLLVGFALAAIKPQVAIVPLLFLAVCHRRRSTWLALGVVALVGSVVFAWSPPWDVAEGLGESLAVHMTQEFNQLRRYDSVFSLATGLVGGEVATWLGLVVGCVLAAALGMRARGATELERIRLLQIAIATSAATMPIHRYDMTLDVLVVATAWSLGSGRRVLVLLALVFARGHAFWIARRGVARLAHSVDPLDLYSTSASVLGGVVLAYLVGCWWADSRLPREPAHAPAA